MSKDFEEYNIFKHGTGALVQHLETGETGFTEVREVAAEVLKVYVNWGSGFEPANEYKLIIRKGKNNAVN